MGVWRYPPTGKVWRILPEGTSGSFAIKWGADFDALQASKEIIHSVDWREAYIRILAKARGGFILDLPFIETLWDDNCYRSVDNIIERLAIEKTETEKRKPKKGLTLLEWMSGKEEKDFEI